MGELGRSQVGTEGTPTSGEVWLPEGEERVSILTLLGVFFMHFFSFSYNLMNPIVVAHMHMLECGMGAATGEKTIYQSTNSRKKYKLMFPHPQSSGCSSSVRICAS